VGAGAAADPPAAPGVELADQLQEPSGGGVEVGRQLGDLVAEAVELDPLRGRRGRKNWGEQMIHESPPGSHPTTRFSTALEGHQAALDAPRVIFDSTRVTSEVAGRGGLLGRTDVEAATVARPRFRKLSSTK
jgi:hypothetical protein